MKSRYFVLDLEMGGFYVFFSLAGNVLSAALSILFAFYKSDVIKKAICICICRFERGGCVLKV